MLSADLESDWCRQRSIDMKNWGAGAGADSQVHFWSIHEGKTYEQSTNIWGTFLWARLTYSLQFFYQTPLTAPGVLQEMCESIFEPLHSTATTKRM
jgi:hypothetical protein